MNVFEIIRQLTGQKNVLTVPALFVRMTGTWEAAALLSQSLYWSDRTSSDDGWFYKTNEQWEGELCLKRKALETARGRCKAFGLEWDVRGIPAKTYYRVDEAVFMAALQTWLAEQDKPVCPNGTNLDAQKEQTSSRPTGQTIYTEPTTEPTSEPTTDARVRDSKILGSKTTQSSQAQPSPSSLKSEASPVSAGIQTNAVEKVPGAPGPDVATVKFLNLAFGQLLQKLLDDPMAPLNVNRFKWFEIPVARCRELADTARKTAVASGTKERTEFIHLLDAEVEDRIKPEPGKPDTTTQALPAFLSRSLADLLDLDGDDDE